MSGTIALARCGEIFRGDIVENAYDAGAVGVVIYTGRKDYGGRGGGAKWFLDDKWMPPSAVRWDQCTVGQVIQPLLVGPGPGHVRSHQTMRRSREMMFHIYLRCQYPGRW